MKIKLYFKSTLVLLVIVSGLRAQTITNYAFTSTSGSFTPVTNGFSPSLTGGDFDEGWYTNIPVGFEFWFMGNMVTTVHASTNGLLSLSQSVPSAAAPNNSLTTNQTGFYKPYVAPLWDNLDMDSVSGAKFSYTTEGVAPNRVFVAEWLNAEWNWFANTAAISFQVRMYETTGIIEYVYREEGGNLFSPSATIGMCYNLNNTFLSLNNSGLSPTVSSTVSTNNINTKPLTGQIYTFTPPVPNGPTTLTFSNIKPTALTLLWNPVAGAIKYAVFLSVDNVNFTYVNSTSTITLVVNALLPNTTYYFRVYSVSEGAYSTSYPQGFATTLTGALAGTYTIPGDFNTLTHALDSIKVTGIAGPVVLELQQTYTSVGERFPIYLSDTLGSSAASPITIRPAAGVTGLVISPPANLWNGTVLITKAKYITIDGRAGGVGNTIALTIKSAGYVPAISFEYGGSANNVISYVRLNSAVTTTSTFSYLEMNNYYNNLPNINNTVQGCEIGDSNMMSTYGIYAYSYAFNVNSSNVIRDNYIYNIGQGYTNSYGITVHGTGNQGWIIEGNHIYNFNTVSGASTTQNVYGIFIVGSGHHIRNNYIGGGAPYCGGNAFEIGPASSTNNFTGIHFVGGGNEWVNIQGNTITNFFWPGGNNSGWKGINIVSGNASIGDTTGNIIGDTTGATGVYVLSQTTNGQANFGILSQTNGVVRINNNRVAGIMVTGVNNTYASSFSAISASNFSDATINNNFIGGTTSGSVRASSANNWLAQSVIAINIGSATNSGTLNIRNNTIMNLLNAGTSTLNSNGTRGIFVYVGGNLNSTISGNHISNLYSHSGNPLTNASTAITGIYYSAPSGTADISGNTIHTLKTMNASSPAHILGIYVSSLSGNAITIRANKIHSFATVSTSIGAGMTGIYLHEGILHVYNNMIRLGIDHDGNSVAGNVSLTGIQKVTSYNSIVTHNSVYIGGTVTAAALVNTYAFRKINDGDDVVTNNIFHNARTNSSTGGRHFAIGLNSAYNITCDYNLVYAPGNNGKLFQLGTTDYNTRMGWYTATGLDDDSDSADAKFINPAGTAATVDLHISATLPTKVEANGTAGFVTDDIDGELRSSFTPVDIGADAGDFIRTATNPLPVEWISIRATRSDNDARVSWNVASQTNNMKFVVQRSYDGASFMDAGSLKGAGTTSVAMVYNFTDAGIFNSKVADVYYRVMQVDHNGKSSYSPVVALSVTDISKQPLVMMPNPAVQYVNIVVPEGLTGNTMEITALDMNGKFTALSHGDFSINSKVDLNGLDQGIYMISVKVDGKLVATGKLVVQ